MMPRRQRPVLCASCMESVRVAGHNLGSATAALELMHGNALLRAEGEELVTLDEKRQRMADDADEIAELRKQLEATRAELQTLRENTEKRTKIQTR